MRWTLRTSFGTLAVLGFVSACSAPEPTPSNEPRINTPISSSTGSTYKPPSTPAVGMSSTPGATSSQHEPARARTLPIPAIAGGTLMIAADGVTAVVSDPERDAVVLVDLSNKAKLATLEFEPGSEPGRSAEDGHRRAHVVLRRAGAVVTIDLARGAVVDRTDGVCGLPRGIAYEASGDRLHVACGDGQLVTLPASGGEPLRRVTIADDSRDVVMSGGNILVSTFRAATVQVVDPSGTVTRVFGLPSGPVGTLGEFSASVAYRMIPNPAGGAIMVHQRSSDEVIDPPPPSTPPAPGDAQKAPEKTSYGGSSTGRCVGVVESGVTEISEYMSPIRSQPIAKLPLAVDIAYIGTREVVVASAAVSDGDPTPGLSRYNLDDLNCAVGCTTGDDHKIPGGEGAYVAVAVDAKNRIIAQQRAPARLRIGNEGYVSLADDERSDPGHDIFHRVTSSGLACASCHPEGHEDGRVWKFSDFGERRTQDLHGGLLATAPFHWGGDMNSFEKLLGDVMVSRMGGSPSNGTAQAAMQVGTWLDRQLPRTDAKVGESESVARGEAIFNRPDTGCAICHSGPHYTNNATVDVGTGGPLQVPSLIGLGMRAPYGHRGCAKSLRDRFDPACGGDRHGTSRQLTAAEVNDLIAFLRQI